MAESFSNKLTRAAGSVTSSTGGSIGITTNLITGISTAGVSVGDMVVNQHYISGTKVSSFGGSSGQVIVDRDSTNTAVASNQIVKFLAKTTVFTASASEKSILIGGTFANNTNDRVDLTIELYDSSETVGVSIASKIPVPAGSSFIISDTGKTILENNDELRVYCDVANAIDVSLSILTGVS